MDIILTLFYILFSVFVIYPPFEFVSAGFTIAQVFESYLGSENTNFIRYHIKRIIITALVHASLPFGYVFCLWVGGCRSEWLPASALATLFIPFIMLYKVLRWLENNKIRHPAVMPLLPYVTAGSDWRVIAADVNGQFHSVDKVSIQITATSKVVVTSQWLFKVTQYGLDGIKLSDCGLVATGTDSHELTTTGEHEVQYVKIEVIPTRNVMKGFSFRVTSTALRELQMQHPITVPNHVSLQQTVVEQFVDVFRHYVNQNRIHYVDGELELCIGCMENRADVKILKRCVAPPPQFPREHNQPPCEPCNCRALWCCSCLARWWAARAAGRPRSQWLGAHCTCPVCRAPFCLLDVSPARARWFSC